MVMLWVAKQKKYLKFSKVIFFAVSKDFLMIFNHGVIHEIFNLLNRRFHLTNGHSLKIPWPSISTSLTSRSERNPMISREIWKSVSLICWEIGFINLRNMTFLRSVSFFYVRLSQLSRRLWARFSKIYECCTRNTLFDLSGVTEVLVFFNNLRVH